jgi:putative ABC transport system permease protein
MFRKYTLAVITSRYLLRHPLQSILMLIGIVLGVAVIVAVDLANVSASRAFDLSTQAVAGKATHSIVSSSGYFDDRLYVELFRSGLIDEIAPILSEYVTSPQLGNVPFQLLGVDPFAEPPFRDYLGFGSDRSGLGQPIRIDQLTDFLVREGAILISVDVAERYSISVGSQIQLSILGRPQDALVVGFVEPIDRLSRRALDGLILADIATVQKFTDRVGLLERIDLILSTDRITLEQQEEAIRKLLHPGILLQPVVSRENAIDQMTTAFRINLTALSLLAMVVGLFLVYNTMTFSVVQRRSFFGTLRCLGVTRTQVFCMVLGEAFIIGVIGSIIGLVVGIIMGQGVVRLVTQSINDLFFTVNVQGVQVPTISLMKGAMVGVIATVFVAAPPAWEAASIPPRLALSRSVLENKAKKAVTLAGLWGVLFIFIGSVILLVPTKGLLVSYAGTFVIVIGFAMFAPTATILIARVTIPMMGRLGGLLGRMAPRGVISALSRTSIAIASLMIAVSVIIGVSLMVSSFRYTVIQWLEQVLQGDIYISVPSQLATQTSIPINPITIGKLNEIEWIDKIYSLRVVMVNSPDGPIQITASSNPEVGKERNYLSINMPMDELEYQLANGGILVSEPLANRLGLHGDNDTISLYTNNGYHVFPILGIYYDYASPLGTVLMQRDIYRRYWMDDAITAIALRIKPGIDVDQAVDQLMSITKTDQALLIRPNLALRSEVLDIFDRTFAITGALQLLATLVAFIGILSALFSLELDRQREHGILRAVGLTSRQLWGLVFLETGLMGAVSGFLAMPTGYALAYILIYIINRRSFGWTLQMQLTINPFVQAFFVALLAALLAGVYPTIRISRMTASDAIRFE